MIDPYGRVPKRALPRWGHGHSFAWTSLGGAVIAAAALLLWLRARTPEPRQFEAIPLTSDRGLELEPRLSPDGRSVAYVWNGPAGDNFDVYVKPVSGGLAQRLTIDQKPDYSPAWSTDGLSIAFLRQIASNRVKVFVVPAIGGDARQLAETDAHSWPHWHLPGPYLEWSPDGKYLFVPASGPNGAFALARLSVSTGAIQRLTEPPAGSWGDMAPAASPDGRQLAFSRCSGWAASDLYVLPLTADYDPAGPARKVTTQAKWNASPAWLPDRNLVFSTGTFESPHLSVVQPSTGRVRSLGPDTAHGWQPTVARSTAGLEFSLAFARHFEAVNIWRQDLSSNAAPSRWIASSRRDLTPQYSPDGKRIAFTSDRTGSEEIWVVANDGTDPQQWTAFNGAHVGAPRWSPDGSRIAFDADVGGRFYIYTTAAPGSRPHQLLESDKPVWLPAWSPDGRSIVFSAGWTGRTQLWKIPSSGGSAVPVTHEEATDAWFSPDGRFLYYLGAGAENHLWRIPADGGSPQRIVEWAGAFVVGSKGLYFTRFRSGQGLADRAIYFVRPGSRHAATVVSSTDILRPGLALSPDGRYLLFAQVGHEVSDLVLAR